jgi:hypothetical protein
LLFFFLFIKQKEALFLIVLYFYMKITNRKSSFLFILIFLTASNYNFGQGIDHWETVVFNDDLWHYSIGNSSIPANWINPDYDVDQWQQGQGGFGYGDGDDNTLLSNIISVFIRTEFEIVDTSEIARYLLQADYDDGFVAYINGVEIARNNLGETGIQTSFNEGATIYHEANLYLDENPETYPILNQSIIKNGKNVLAIQAHNIESSSSDLSSNFFLSVGIKNTSMNYRPVPDWFENSFFQTKLPILVITTDNNAEIVDEPKIDGDMGVIYNGENQINSIFDPYNDYDGRIGIEIRGTSSQIYDKKGFGLETREEDGSNNNVELLGMPEENDWVLYGPYADKSLLRNVFTYYMGGLTGQYAPRTRFCELFINDQYRGIYVLTEKIKRDKNRVDISKLTETENSGDDLTGGYIIKVDRNPDDIPGQGWYSTFPDNKFFEYEYPKDDEITAAQKNYIQNYMFEFESAMDKDDYEDTYEDFIDITSWADYFLVTEISKHIDAYKLSFYMYKDKDSKGGKLHMGPLWDINFGFGNFNFSCSPDPEGWAYEFPLCGSWHPFWARKIADIPNLQHLTNCRWQELREGPFQTDSLMLFIDEQVAYLGEAINRNFDRWPILGEYVWANDFIGETYLEELDFLKNWTISRLEWMDDNMVGDCELYTSNTNIPNSSSLNIFPNPASEYIQITNFQFEKNRTQIDIIDMHGKAVFTNEIKRSQASIPVNGLSDGIYVLILKIDGKIMSQQKFIKKTGF